MQDNTTPPVTAEGSYDWWRTEVAARDADLERLRARIAVLQDREEEVLDPLRTQVVALQRELTEAREHATYLDEDVIKPERKLHEQTLAERDTAVAAVRTAQIAHIREWHPNYAHVGACSACQVLVPLSLAMPARPDDPEEIRRLMQATIEETDDG